jgi:hypothetical protein
MENEIDKDTPVSIEVRTRKGNRKRRHKVTFTGAEYSLLWLTYGMGAWRHPKAPGEPCYPGNGPVLVGLLKDFVNRGRTLSADRRAHMEDQARKPGRESLWDIYAHAVNLGNVTGIAVKVDESPDWFIMALPRHGWSKGRFEGACRGKIVLTV